jgi:hypothetical protein
MTKIFTRITARSVRAEFFRNRKWKIRTRDVTALLLSTQSKSLYITRTLQSVSLGINGGVRTEVIRGVNDRRVTEFSYAVQTDELQHAAVPKLGEHHTRVILELNNRPFLKCNVQQAEQFLAKPSRAISRVTCIKIDVSGPAPSPLSGR